MRHSLLLAALLCSVSQVAAQPSPAPLTRAQMESDFDVLISALKEAHGGLYRFTKQEDLDRWFQSCRKELPASATRVQFGSLLREAIAPIRDGHNRLEYDEAILSQMNAARLLPLRMQIEGQRLMVLFNDTPGNQNVKPGMEILSINGKSSSEVLNLMYSRMTCDGFIETGKQRGLERTFHTQYLLQVNPAPTFDIRCKGADGKEFSVTLEGVTNADRVSARNVNPVNAAALKALDIPGTQTENIILSFSADNKIAILRIRGFEGGAYTSQLDAAFATVREKGSTGMILDLRGNGGGVDMDGAYLVSQFAEKPFRYFDHIQIKTLNPSFTTWKPDTYTNLREGTVADAHVGYLVQPRLHPGVGEQQPVAKPFSGRLIVLIDGNTFSTAADVCAVLREMKRGQFIGEETGGAAEGNTSGLNATVMLPNSGHKLRVQMYGYWNAVKAERGRGTLPDVAVERKAEDLILGIDKQKETALELLRK